MPAFLQDEAPSVLRVPGWWGRKEVGRGGVARHMAENATQKFEGDACAGSF